MDRLGGSDTEGDGAWRREGRAATQIRTDATTEGVRSRSVAMVRTELRRRSDSRSHPQLGGGECLKATHAGFWSDNKLIVVACIDDRIKFRNALHGEGQSK